MYLGWARDFWKDFEHYPALEAGLPSTFFVIPFQGKPGRGVMAARRLGNELPATASPISKTASTVSAQPGARSDCTESMHGVTARKPVRRWSSFSVSRQSENRGVRMHWLYFDQQSPDVLDSAGADYDSTAGYNEAIGYRTGTAQAYKPLEARRLLELPLIIMDTALFFPKRQDLSAKAARGQVQAILEHAAASGGCITVNWHDRSISPERNWGGFYTHLIQGTENARRLVCDSIRGSRLVQKTPLRCVLIRSGRTSRSGNTAARLSFNYAYIP